MPGDVVSTRNPLRLIAESSKWNRNLSRSASPQTGQKARWSPENAFKLEEQTLQYRSPLGARLAILIARHSILILQECGRTLRSCSTLARSIGAYYRKHWCMQIIYFSTATGPCGCARYIKRIISHRFTDSTVANDLRTGSLVTCSLTVRRGLYLYPDQAAQLDCQ